MDLSLAIKELVKTKGLSQELIISVIIDTLKEAYLKFYGIDDIKFKTENEKIDIYLNKNVVENVVTPVKEISLKEAKKFKKNVKVGEEIEVITSPEKDFNNPKSLQWVIDNILRKIKEAEKDIIGAEYKSKINKLVSGKVIKKDSKGSIFVDLGDTLGYLPVEEQSPLEHYEVDDVLKAIVKDVLSFSKRKGKDNRIVLSRTSPYLIKELLKLNVPEIQDTIEIKKIVREVGYKTKILVYSDSVDPLSACVGPQGVRITSIIKEIGGEKIDIVRYSDDPKELIKNALVPAKVNRVILTDDREAFAIVEKDQVAYAFGKQRKNVVLAAKLTGWKINVKVESEIGEEIEKVGAAAIDNIIGTSLKELGLADNIIEKLNENNIYIVEQLVDAVNNNDLISMKGLTEEDIEDIKKIISEKVEIELEEEGEGIPIENLPDISNEIIDKIKNNNIQHIEDLIKLMEVGKLNTLKGISVSELELIEKVIRENVEIE
ncbi:MAG TPA: transcription termination factor NusA [Spirochaetota bacterium]|nr:transcription termination factor NusA [Spirochaetota bacterium]HOM38730.1 transcription termination factor NusA [Spirochaetota bacterium]HPQ49527.1 transcription termination factor NusA [Spirochaetota bacterium]